MNIVLIMIDALRADHLGCYGYKRNTSPNIDRLAREGALFTQVLAASSHTPTSMGSIATSTYPPSNGLLGWGNTLDPEVPTLAETLRAHGYKTVFLGGSESLRTALHGFDRGFDVFAVSGASASFLTQNAIGILERSLAKPFFLWLHYMDVHDYAPEKRFESVFMNDPFYDEQKKLPIVKSFPESYGRDGIPSFWAEKKGFSDNPDHYIALYDEGLRSVDEQIGVLLQSLDRLGNRANTLVVLTADHGEMMGEHGFYFHHGVFLYEPLLRVPLILRKPNSVRAQTVTTLTAASLDIFPTLLGFLKILPSRTLEGADLSRALLGKDKAFSSYVFSDEGVSRRCVRTDAWKLIRFRHSKGGAPETWELFHLKTDPGETTDLSLAEKSVFGSLKNKLVAYEDRYYSRRQEVVPQLDAPTRENLKSLGYLQ